MTRKKGLPAILGSGKKTGGRNGMSSQRSREGDVIRGVADEERCKGGKEAVDEYPTGNRERTTE